MDTVLDAVMFDDESCQIDIDGGIRQTQTLWLNSFFLCTNDDENDWLQRHLIEFIEEYVRYAWKAWKAIINESTRNAKRQQWSYNKIISLFQFGSEMEAKMLQIDAIYRKRQPRMRASQPQAIHSWNALFAPNQLSLARNWFFSLVFFLFALFSIVRYTAVYTVRCT